LALGRIGGPRAAAVLGSVAPATGIASALQAAQCLRGGDCVERIKWLADVVRGGTSRGEAVRAAVDAMSVLGSQGHHEAISALVDLSASVSAQQREDVAVAFAGTAVRDPAAILAWLGASAEPGRRVAIELLHDGFERLEEDFAEEQFFAAARAAYWAAPEGSAGRALVATLIDRLEF
jgi:hypothetical protein